MKKLLLALSLLVMNSASAVVITSYDVENATLSGSGNWQHTYDGTITPLNAELANYSNGSGTLNDGIKDNLTAVETQLFNTSGVSPVITLYFDAFYTLNDLTIFGGPSNNAIPGTLSDLDISIAGQTESFQTVGSGKNDWVDISISSLANIATNQISLSGFKSTYWTSSEVFSIGEIELTGNLASTATVNVPEPTSLAIFSLALLLVALRAKVKY